MCSTSDLLAVFVLIGSRWLVLDKLRAALRMLTFTQSCEVVCSDGAAQFSLRRKSATPFAVCVSVAAPVVLLLRRELTRVIGLSLPCGKGRGDGQHGSLLRLRARLHLVTACRIQ